LKETASGLESSANALQRTDTFRSLERTGNHIWRICHYLSQGRTKDSQPEAAATPHPAGSY